MSPHSIVVIGASNNITKPGGKILKNLIEHEFKGNLFAVNPNDESVQGVKTFKSINDLPTSRTGYFGDSAKGCLDAVSVLTKQKKTKAFIIISGGFSEMGHEGALLEIKL